MVWGCEYLSDSPISDRIIRVNEGGFSGDREGYGYIAMGMAMVMVILIVVVRVRVMPKVMVTVSYS